MTHHAAFALTHAVLGAGAAPDPEGPLTRWVVLGPFPNARGAGREDFDRDALATIGGEASARLMETTTIEVVDVAGRRTLAARVAEAERGVLDFGKLLTPTDFQLAYAYTEIVSESVREAVFLLGSDDGAKVWVNGAPAFETFPAGGRPLARRQDRFSATLAPGTNRILVKVENGTGGWQLALEAYGPEAAARIDAQRELERRMTELMGQQVGPTGWFVFQGAAGFPRIVWRDVDRVRELVGEAPLTVRWFDAERREVEAPSAPGRYGAVIEATLPDGTPVRRAMTFYCAPEGASLFWPGRPFAPPYPGPPVDPVVWREHLGTIGLWAGSEFGPAFASSPAAGTLLAWLHELTPGRPAAPMVSPEVADDEYHLALRLQREGRAKEARPLEPPADRSGDPAPVLREGTAQEAGFREGAKERIDAACRAWAADSGEPFTTLVARHGVIVTHAAYGCGHDGRPLPLDFRYEIASITKAVTGLLFSRFVDQGFVGIDEPVGHVLPGFPTEGPKALTYRHLFTHTSGLDGHANWGGIHNPYLDNVILGGLAGLRPGEVHLYNGMGYDLAGKAMELLTGKSIVRLMYEDLFVPLGLTETPPVVDLGFGARLTVRELATLAQCMANRGSYGEKQLLSEETFAKLLPVPLRDFWPEIEVDWGIGFTPYVERRPSEGADAPGKPMLGEQVIGHGSATSCILRVALDTGVTVSMVRRTAGERYEEHLMAVLAAIDEGML